MRVCIRCVFNFCKVGPCTRDLSLRRQWGEQRPDLNAVFGANICGPACFKYCRTSISRALIYFARINRDINYAIFLKIAKKIMHFRTDSRKN